MRLRATLRVLNETGVTVSEVTWFDPARVPNVGEGVIIDAWLCCVMDVVTEYDGEEMRCMCRVRRVEKR